VITERPGCLARFAVTPVMPQTVVPRPGVVNFKWDGDDLCSLLEHVASAPQIGVWLQLDIWLSEPAARAIRYR
jgi:hypothetical protein